MIYCHNGYLPSNMECCGCFIPHHKNPLKYVCNECGNEYYKIQIWFIQWLSDISFKLILRAEKGKMSLFKKDVEKIMAETKTIKDLDFFVKNTYEDDTTDIVKFTKKGLEEFLSNIEVFSKTCENCKESIGCQNEILRSEGIACSEWGSKIELTKEELDRSCMKCVYENGTNCGHSPSCPDLKHKYFAPKEVDV